MDHQKLDQARAALTPSLTLCPHPNEDSKDLGQVWGPPLNPPLEPRGPWSCLHHLGY